MIICVTQTTLIGESVTNALTSCVEVIIRGAKVIIIILLLITAPHSTTRTSGTKQKPFQ